MSLYVGHLPLHIRPEELEQVFRRFGRCNLQLKDGYGFIIYEVTANAERALQELRGKNICGEQISLNWSNRQPRPFQKSARPIRVYEPYHGRNFREEDNGVGIRGARDRRDFSVDNSLVPSYNQGGHRLDDVLSKEAGHVREDIDHIGGERGLSLKEGVMDEAGTSEHNPEENDRWGGPVSDGLTSHGIGNGTEFDRYEPYHGYSRRDEKEINQMTSSYGSPDHRSSREKGRREHSVDETVKNLDKSKPQLTCYNCGLVGHIKRNCPEGDARQEKFNKFRRRDEINFRDRGDRRLKMLRTNSWRRPDASRDPLISWRHARDRKEHHSEKARRLVRRSDSFPERREKAGPKLRAESQEKKQSKRESEDQKKVLKKRRAKRSDTPSLSSDSSTTSSQSHSRSSKSNSGTSLHSGPRPASSRSGSASSSSRSASTSSYSKSKSLRSRSRSRSRFPKSPSLSVSLDKKSPSFSKNVHTNVSMSTFTKGNSEHVISPNSKHVVLANMESSELKDENALVTFKVDNETDEEHSGQNGVDGWYSASMVGYEEKNSCIDVIKGIAAASENRREKSQVQGALPVMPNMQFSVGCGASNSKKITAQEMFLALKHYGLPAPEEGVSGISAEGYFGAARLWPWEMIYYRRLKKGPISTENYARRLEQNKEFGIVDKYVRSSSGWGECEQNEL